MKIRLHGTRTEIAAALHQIRALLDVQDVSRIYADRPPSTLVRIYLTAQPANTHSEI